MDIIHVDSPSDPRLSDYSGLTDVALRTSRETAEGLFMAEGAKVITRAVQAGYPVRSVLTEAKWIPGLADAIPDGAPVFVGSAQTLGAITGYRVHRGALAAMSRIPLPTVADVCSGAATIAVLEDLVDHTNVGAVFRNAAALGLGGVVLSPGCADPLYRRSVKVSMGAVFAVPWARADSWPAALDELSAQGFALLALTPAGVVDLRAVRPGRNALMLGTEGDGLSAAALDRADARVVIPMAGGVDSLNVAAASAIAFHHLAAAPVEGHGVPR